MTKSTSRRIARLTTTLVAGLLALGVVAPFINANWASTHIQSALESALGRKVHFGAVHFSLFSGPGFSIENVTIGEDPRYGLEPFAFVPTLNVRLRLDKLLFRRLQISSLELVEPSLNLVKASDGTWNVVKLVSRLTTRRNALLSFLPSFEISEGRINLKLGTRKNTLYIAQSDISIYPQRAGQLYLQFSGSPARTDRAGHGFGHLRGNATWAVRANSNTATQLSANVILDPSNLGELTTLLGGYDVGVHGTVSSNVHLEGPAEALELSGNLHLDDVHRWDLLPASGDGWTVGYKGRIDLATQTFNLQTVPAHAHEQTPVIFRMNVTNFLAQPVWTALAQINGAPATYVLPLARRMGVPVPDQFAMTGQVNGAIGYSTQRSWQGAMAVENAVATIPEVPPMQIPRFEADLLGDQVRFSAPALETGTAGTLSAEGEYTPATQSTSVTLRAANLPLQDFRQTAAPWLGLPEALQFLRSGHLSGTIHYSQNMDAPPAWSGQLQVADGSIQPPGVGESLKHVGAHVAFADLALDVTRFVATAGTQVIRGDYHYAAAEQGGEHLTLHVPALNLNSIESLFDSTLRGQGLWARLRVGHRSLPAWLASRQLEADVVVDRFTVQNAEWAPLRAHLSWQGSSVQFRSVEAKLASTSLRAQGSLDLSGYLPRYRFNAAIVDLPYKGGLLNVEGDADSSGVGSDAFMNLHGEGHFAGANLVLSDKDTFDRLSGTFKASLAEGWLDLQLADVEGEQSQDVWQGAGISQRDGKLVLNLQSDERQRQIISDLETGSIAPFSLLVGKLEDRPAALR